MLDNAISQRFFFLNFSVVSIRILTQVAGHGIVGVSPSVASTPSLIKMGIVLLLLHTTTTHAFVNRRYPFMSKVMNLGYEILLKN